jgi:hypothetical protein
MKRSSFSKNRTTYLLRMSGARIHNEFSHQDPGSSSE